MASNLRRINNIIVILAKHDHDGTRTHNLPIRSRTPYPLGHAAMKDILYIACMHERTFSHLLWQCQQQVRVLQIEAMMSNTHLTLRQYNQHMSYLFKHFQAGWPSGLRRWFKAPVTSVARVRIPLLSYLAHKIFMPNFPTKVSCIP